MGRVVITHSTYLEGLIPWLKAISKINGIKTVIPGEIRRVKSHKEKLSLRISTKILGGYKVIARKASLAQEIFITTVIEKEILIREIEACRPK